MAITGFAIITWNNPKNRRNPTSPRDNTCRSLGLIFPWNKVLMVDPSKSCPVPALALENSVHCCAKDLPYICRHSAAVKKKITTPLHAKKNFFVVRCAFSGNQASFMSENSQGIFQVTIAETRPLGQPQQNKQGKWIWRPWQYLESERLHPSLKNGNHLANGTQFFFSICPKNYYTPRKFRNVEPKNHPIFHKEKSSSIRLHDFGFQKLSIFTCMNRWCLW